MQLSLDYMNKRGYVCEIVERWNHFGKVRHDCFGFGDILCIAEKRIVLVQATSWSNFLARKQKILESPIRGLWLLAGGRICLQAWGPKGLREEEL